MGKDFRGKKGFDDTIETYRQKILKHLMPR